MKPKFMLIHGNGGATADEIWLPETTRQLREAGYEVINRTFPDNVKARCDQWLPFITELGADEHTVIVGHSSGAVAAMRFAETHRLLGSVLIGACYTDLGDDGEKASGYYDSPWNWQAIKEHQQWIIQFASSDDPYIPIEEARFIHEHLETDYRESTNRGHFMAPTFPALVPAIIEKLQ